MKPVVRYVGEAYRTDNGHAFLRPIDHPNHHRLHRVTNTKHIRTSHVLSWDELTGRIETVYTIYEPIVLKPVGPRF